MSTKVWFHCHQWYRCSNTPLNTRKEKNNSGLVDHLSSILVDNHWLERKQHQLTQKKHVFTIYYSKVDKKINIITKNLTLKLHCVCTSHLRYLSEVAVYSRKLLQSTRFTHERSWNEILRVRMPFFNWINVSFFFYWKISFFSINEIDSSKVHTYQKSDQIRNRQHDALGKKC